MEGCRIHWLTWWAENERWFYSFISIKNNTLGYILSNHLGARKHSIISNWEKNVNQLKFGVLSHDTNWLQLNIQVHIYVKNTYLHKNAMGNELKPKHHPLKIKISTVKLFRNDVH
jgi:hypothetical protein